MLMATANHNAAKSNQQPRPEPRTEYVQEIDGLRAVAVLSVLLFHAGFQKFSGGFVGVDIFFVISGYLITKIILKNHERRMFSYIQFMVKRIARLYPALIVTLLICLAGGFLLFSPLDYKNLAKTTGASLLSLSNFLFWKSAGYFDTSSVTNPLLHTWSLAVEQQFYLIWPLLIYALYRAKAQLMPYALIAIALLSLFASQRYASVDPVANYFLMPFRVFEFAIGGLVIWIERYRPNKNIWLEILLAAGFSLLLYSVFFFNQSTVFPGLNALIPAIGAGLCIVACEARYLGMVLRNRVAVFIGVISYSLYLVHWPIIVFYKYYIFRPLETVEKVALVLGPVLVAYPMYKYVESKYRKVNILKLPMWGYAKLISILLVVAVPALLIFKHGGLTFRINGHIQARNINPEKFQEEQFGGVGYSQGSYDLGSPTAETPSALILGDSYARQHAISLDKLFKELNGKIHTSFMDACFFSRRYTSLMYGKPRKECTARLDYAISYLERHPELPLIYAINWGGYETLISTLDGKQVFFKDAEYTDLILGNITEIASLIGNRKLIIIGAPPGIGSPTSIGACLERPHYLPNDCVKRLTADESKGNGYAINLAIKDLIKDNNNIIFLPPGDAFCKDGKCMSILNNEFIYSDAHHLSKFGSSIFVNHFKDTFKRLVK